MGITRDHTQFARLFGGDCPITGKPEVMAIFAYTSPPSAGYFRVRDNPLFSEIIYDFEQSKC